MRADIYSVSSLLWPTCIMNVTLWHINFASPVLAALGRCSQRQRRLLDTPSIDCVYCSIAFSSMNAANLRRVHRVLLLCLLRSPFQRNLQGQDRQGGWAPATTRIAIVVSIDDPRKGRPPSVVVAHACSDHYRPNRRGGRTRSEHSCPFLEILIFF